MVPRVTRSTTMLRPTRSTLISRLLPVGQAGHRISGAQAGCTWSSSCSHGCSGRRLFALQQLRNLSDSTTRRPAAAAATAAGATPTPQWQHVLPMTSAMLAVAAGAIGYGLTAATEESNPFTSEPAAAVALGANGHNNPFAADSPLGAALDANGDGGGSGSGGGQARAVVEYKTTVPPQILAGGRNVVLGDKSLPEALRPHRVALCEWPADQARHNGDARTASPRALFKVLHTSLYCQRSAVGRQKNNSHTVSTCCCSG